MKNETRHSVKVKCKFCHKNCEKYIRDKKRFWWWDCKDCKVKFLAHLSGNIVEMEYKSEEKDNKYYTVNLILPKNKTEIWIWENPYPKYVSLHYDCYKVTSFDKLLEITPQNFEQKLKTYLLLL